MAFMIPIMVYLCYRIYQHRKARSLITGGEIFDKEGDRVGMIEDGTEFEIPIRKS